MVAVVAHLAYGIALGVLLTADWMRQLPAPGEIDRSSRNHRWVGATMTADSRGDASSLGRVAEVGPKVAAVVARPACSTGRVAMSRTAVALRCGAKSDDGFGTADSSRGDRPIEDYGLIGDTRCAALVASDGSIDWMCVPRFDGPPVFGRLVGGPDAGTFRAWSAGSASVIVRRYRPETASLETTWRTEAAGSRSRRNDCRGDRRPVTFELARASAGC